MNCSPEYYNKKTERSEVSHSKATGGSGRPVCDDDEHPDAMMPTARGDDGHPEISASGYGNLRSKTKT